MTSTSDWNNPTSVTVVAYFSSGVDAQDAINELIDEGFPVDAIGAVLHSGGAAAVDPNAEAPSSPSRPRHDEMTQFGSTASAAGTSGPESDTSGVTPAGLSTGAGTGFTGAPTRPGPIPGSEIPSSIPSERPSSLEPSVGSRATEPASRQDLDVSYGELSASPSPSTTYVPTTESRSEPHSDQSWWDKLKHLFSRDTDRKREPQSDKGATKFGTRRGSARNRRV
jgi:hypothetical protein